MTIPKKGSRKISVGESEYEWRIRKKPTYMQAVSQTPMRIAVQASTQGPRKVLLVDLSVSRPDNWIARHGTGITPATVRDIIERALAAGWVPCSTGPAFIFRYAVVQDTVGTVF
ncbi:hypothetical protein WA016_01350 [Myxococcus stipitatus]